MSTGQEGFRSRSAALRWLSTALIMSAIRTNFPGKAARRQKHLRWSRFLPAEELIGGKRDRLTKILAPNQEMPDRTKDYFKQNLSLETLHATIRWTKRMVSISDETAQCFRNEPFVNICHSILHR